MTDLYPFLLLLAAPLLFAAARFFKDAEIEPRRWLSITIGAGAVAGAGAALVRDVPGIPPGAALAGLLAIAVIWAVRRDEGDAIDGALSGGLVAIGFALPLTLVTRKFYPTLPILLIAGPVAGAIGASWPGGRGRKLAVAAAAMAGGIAAAFGASRLALFVDPATLASAAVVTTALAAAAAPLVRWRAVLEELQEEARIGILDQALVSRIAHPFRRIQQAPGDPDARRRITRLAWTLALRKRHQRRLAEAQARLQHLEILKLRSELAAVQGIAREIALLDRAAAEGSDRIIVKG